MRPGASLALLGLLAFAPAARGATPLVAGVVVDGRAFVPLDDLVQAAGGTLERHADPRRVTLVVPGRRAELTIDDPFVRLDDRMVELPEPLRLLHGDLLLPAASVRLLSAAAFDLDLAWDARAQAVIPASRPAAAPAARTALRMPHRTISSGIPVVVLDPGHGGADAGVEDGLLQEKALTLELARRIAASLQRAGVRVVLTRGSDLQLAPAARAEIANRAGADVVVTLHVGEFPSLNARGATIWSPPPLPADPGAPFLRPWERAAGAFADRASALADSLAAAFDRAELGPAHVRERLALGLVGVNAPSVLLQVGSLSAPAERARLASASGLDSIAVAVTDGLRAWGRW